MRVESSQAFRRLHAEGPLGDSQRVEGPAGQLDVDADRPDRRECKQSQLTGVREVEGRRRASRSVD
jgi:hypothetical protein